MMRNVIMLAVLVGGTVVVNAKPLLSMRLRANDTESEAAWQANFTALAAHPGCCDEIWFSTGVGAPSLDWHRANVRVLGKAVTDCHARGIVPSLQFQATIGHGDTAVVSERPEMFAMKKWTGWTGWSGIETKTCNCPRQPAFHAYLREVSKIYAPLGFAGLWIDDDLRIAHHQPSDSYGRRIGCWCQTCMSAFNAETGAKWTREVLAEAVMKDEVLAARWRKFSIDGLCLVARSVAEVFHEIAPETMMALQHGCEEDNVDQVLQVSKTLHEVSGRPVGIRPGGGAYYDDDPNGVVLKSICESWFRARLGNPDWVTVWTPEIESWPRTYYSRSSQGVLAEGFTALMYGMNAVSFFISNGAKEDPELYGRTFWKTLSEAAPALHGYAQTIEGCAAVGFVMPGEPTIGVRRAAIPVLAGPGHCAGTLTDEECKTRINRVTSAEVQALRDALDRRAGGLPAVVRSPFSGLLQIHVDAIGNLRSVALVNARITEQGPIRIRLRNVPADWTAVDWNEMCRPPLRLELDRREGSVFVTIPSVGAWNGGYLSGAKTEG